MAMNSNAQEPHLRLDTALLADEVPEPRPIEPRARPRRIVLAVVAVGIIIALGAWIMTQYRIASAPPPPPSIEPAPVAAVMPPSPPATSAPPATRYPIDVPERTPLPPLNASDRDFVADLGDPMLARWLIPNDVIRRIVVTVDNLPRKSFPAQMSPVAPTAGMFTVADGGISAANAARYAAMVQAFGHVDPEKLVAVYIRWYLRFQDAYRELGFPSGNFNDRLVDTLDMLLATPQITGHLGVVQPKVLWKFANPALEELPAGQKIMLRMGTENAESVNARLLAIRRLIAPQTSRQ
jgi:hypothetical protein